MNSECNLFEFGGFSLELRLGSRVYAEYIRSNLKHEANTSKIELDLNLLTIKLFLLHKC